MRWQISPTTRGDRTGSRRCISSSQLPAQAYEENRAASAEVESRSAPDHSMPELADTSGEQDCGARVMSAPIRPTQEMIEEHNVHHVSLWSWCNLCVRGRGNSVGHFKVKRDDEQASLLAVDYGFLGGAAFLAIKDRFTKVVSSNMVPNKGLEPGF